MFDIDLVNEADRQFSICNACRYCEGFCAVFPAAELRTKIADADLGYLANLCHDCRMCYDACMFAPPHEFAINVPELLAEARVQTYQTYGVPGSLARLVRVPRAGVATIVAIGIAIVLAAVAFYGGAGALSTARVGPGSLYRVLPYLAIVIPALALAILGVAAAIAGGVRFGRDIRGTRPVTWASFGRAAHEALSLVYMQGGGAGCYDVHRGSQSRRIFHSLVFWGFVADLASTSAAAICQDILAWLPPYPLLSVPVVLGTLGGIAIVIGCAGLIWVKRRSDSVPQAPRMVAMDYAFLSLLLSVALTGLALLVFRFTRAMPSLLAIHLGALIGLFVTAPYGKFVHFFYRIIALAQNSAEQHGG